MNDAPSTPPPSAGRSVVIGDTPAPEAAPAQPQRSTSGVIYAIAAVLALALITVMVLASTWKSGDSPAQSTGTAQGPAGGPGGVAPSAGTAAAMMSEGSPTAPNVLVEYADYRCPYCGVWARETHPKLKPFIESGKLRMEFRDMAIFGQNSIDVAAAARAAGKQGKFWQYWHAIWAKVPTSGHPDFGEGDLVGFARDAAVPNLGQFTKDMKDPALKKQVQADTQAAQELGIQAVPMFVLNNTPINGNQKADVFLKLIAKTVNKQ